MSVLGLIIVMVITLVNDGGGIYGDSVEMRGCWHRADIWVMALRKIMVVSGIDGEDVEKGESGLRARLCQGWQRCA